MLFDNETGGTSVAQALRKCIAGFKEILAKVETEKQQHPASTNCEWNDEFSRLRIWAANVGAHRVGRRSLDFRLRDASHIRIQITDLLSQLSEILEEWLQSYTDNTAADDDYVSDENSSFSGDQTTNCEDIFCSARLRIDLLFDMVLSVRKPAKLDRFAHIVKDLARTFHPYDMLHVENKFPNADTVTQRLLSDALSFRRGVLKLYENRHQSLSRGIDDAFEKLDDIQAAETIVAESSAMLSSAYTETNQSSDQLSVTSGSVWSMRSILDASKDLHVPLPKDLQAKKPFPCPYCYYLIDFYDPREFARHVFDDITPYHCIFVDCPQSQHITASKKQWIKHLEVQHTDQWLSVTQECCPCCRSTAYNGQSMAKHVARHLEELALFALPSLDTADDVENTDEEASSADLSSAPSSAIAQRALFESDYDHGSMEAQENSTEIVPPSALSPQSNNLIFSNDGATHNYVDVEIASNLGWQPQWESPTNTRQAVESGKQDFASERRRKRGHSDGQDENAENKDSKGNQKHYRIPKVGIDTKPLTFYANHLLDRSFIFFENDSGSWLVSSVPVTEEDIEAMVEDTTSWSIEGKKGHYVDSQTAKARLQIGRAKRDEGPTPKIPWN